ncbi:MAG: beta-lactamase family protein [Oscillospiraceae bacterium]|nr:beta-lactamase family protein [Oscillospiraceae bacterium]
MKRTISAKIIALVLCIIMLVGVLASAAHALSNEAQDHILNALARARIPNAAIAVIQDGETNYILRDSTTDTLFQIGSVSKSFTGFGVLLLEDMGLLSVYDPVNQHLPWFEVRYHGVPVPHEDMAIYHVLQMASGITSDERHFPRPAATESTDAFIARLSQGLDLAFYPAARHVYGNLNYIILGLLIEAVSGQSYDEFMTQQVLHQLGMYNTFTNTQRAHETGRVIGGNRLRFLQPVSWEPLVHPAWIPTGFIYSNVTDMVRWAQVQLGMVEIDEQFGRVVQRSHEPMGSVDFFAHGNYFYTAGWNVRDDGAHVRHYGATPGYSAAFRLYPHAGTAVIVLGNLAHGVVPFGSFVTDVVERGSFNRMGMEFNVMMDIFLTVLAALTIVYVVLFVRLIVNLMKKRNEGRITTRECTFKAAWLIDPLITVAGLIALYVVPPMFGNTSLAFALEYIPASWAFAVAGGWVAVAYSVCSLLYKAFLKPQTAK